MDAMQAIELAPYLADAWTIPFYTKESDSEKVIYDLLKYSKFTVPSLVGEIFTEEEREFTKVYEAILRLIGAGELDYKNIASILASRKVITRADSSLIIPYIKNMEGMGWWIPCRYIPQRKKCTDCLHLLWRLFSILLTDTVLKTGT